MLKGVNDSLADAKALVQLLAGIPAKINLIPFNPWPGTTYECSDWDRIEEFAEIVINAGYASPVRTPRGADILAACGQLKSALLGGGFIRGLEVAARRAGGPHRPAGRARRPARGLRQVRRLVLERRARRAAGLPPAGSSAAIAPYPAGDDRSC